MLTRYTTFPNLLFAYALSPRPSRWIVDNIKPELTRPNLEAGPSVPTQPPMLPRTRTQDH